MDKNVLIYRFEIAPITLTEIVPTSNKIVLTGKSRKKRIIVLARLFRSEYHPECITFIEYRLD